MRLSSAQGEIFLMTTLLELSNSSTPCIGYGESRWYQGHLGDGKEPRQKWAETSNLITRLQEESLKPPCVNLSWILWSSKCISPTKPKILSTDLKDLHGSGHGETQLTPSSNRRFTIHQHANFRFGYLDRVRLWERVELLNPARDS